MLAGIGRICPARGIGNVWSGEMRPQPRVRAPEETAVLTRECQWARRDGTGHVEPVGPAAQRLGEVSPDILAIGSTADSHNAIRP